MIEVFINHGGWGMVKKLLLMVSVLCIPCASFGAETVQVKPELTSSAKYIQTAKGVGLGLISAYLWTCGLAGLGTGCKEGVYTKDVMRRLSQLLASACLLVPAYKLGTKSLEHLRTIWGVPYE